MLALYQQFGEHLVNSATRAFDRSRAFAAVAIFDAALKESPNDPTFLNDAGVALTVAAQTLPYPAMISFLAGARQRFQKAFDRATEQGAATAALRRYDVNLALASLSLGGLIGDDGLVSRAIEIFRRVVATSRAKPDRVAIIDLDMARARSGLGNALMALGGHTAEAIAAYETERASLSKRKNPVEYARCLQNLGTAHAAEGHLDEARRLYREALTLLTERRDPVLWSKIQDNLVTALVRMARQPDRPSADAINLYSEAVDAGQAALMLRPRSEAPSAWAVTTFNLAQAFLGLGGRICDANPDAREQGVGHIRHALALYKHALPDLSPGLRNDATSYIDVAIEILKEALGGDSSAEEEIEAHRQELQAGLEAWTNVNSPSAPLNYLDYQEWTKETIYSYYSGTIVPMENEETILAAILRAIADLPRDGQLAVLDRATRRISVQAFPNEVVRRDSAAYVITNRAKPTRLPLSNDPSPPSITGSRAETHRSSSMPDAAQALFGTLPEGLSIKAYKKSNFPEDWFDNVDVVRAARRIVYAYKNRDTTIELPTREKERVQEATRFMRAYERRRQRISTRGPAAPG